MKRLPIVLLLSFIFSSFLVSQGKITKIAIERKNADQDDWKIYSVDSWDYDEQEREVLFIHRDDIVSDFHPYNFRSIASSYDGNGKLISQDYFNDGNSRTWEKNFITYEYHTDGSLKESITDIKSSSTDDAYYIKISYEKDELENRRTIKRFSAANAPENWILETQRDSFFDDNGCLTKQTILNYSLEGLVGTKWWIATYSNDCRILTNEFWIGDQQTNTMFLHRKNTYEYLNDGKITRNTYERSNNGSNQLELEYIIEEEVDDEGRKIGYRWENFRHEKIDTLEEKHTYTSRGEIETIKRYETRYRFSDEPLHLTRSDSFSYHYNSEERLVKKENISNFSFTSYYDYYCNGQLKTETSGYNGNIDSRKTYYYHGGVNCPLEGDAPDMIIFPNPTVGDFTIHSNLLAEGNVDVNIYTLVGQLIYSKKIEHSTYQFRIELPVGLKGQFMISIDNKEQRFTEKLIIH